MAKQGKTSKRQDSAAQSAARDAGWSRGQERKKERHALQVAAHEVNVKNKKDGIPTPWEVACKKRFDRPDQATRRRQGAIRALENR